MHYILFLIQLLAIFFLTKKTTNEVFNFFRAVGVEEKTIFIIVSILFLPGTILHELAHFFAAMILFMKVREVKILPEFEENEIKLGRVLYEKKDFVRGILVGIAPPFAGLLFFWTIAFFKLFPNQNLLITILLAYLVFAVSSTMFSSKQDLVDIIYVIPIAGILSGLIYVFNLRLDWVMQNTFVTGAFARFISQINWYLLLSLALNLSIIACIKALQRIVSISRS